MKAQEDHGVIMVPPGYRDEIELRMEDVVEETGWNIVGVLEPQFDGDNITIVAHDEKGHTSFGAFRDILFMHLGYSPEAE